MAREANDFVTEQFTLKQVKEQHKEEQALEEVRGAGQIRGWCFEADRM